jgi:amidohydrolase
MTTTDITEIRALTLRTIDGATRDLITAAKTVYSTPETGFNEYKTAAYVQDRLQALGFVVESGMARTGMKAVLRGAKPGPTIAVIAELDSLRVPTHPGADPQTGAAHACGHHAQTGAILGVATALSVPEVRDSLAGNVAFIITPAEEFIEIQDRLALRNAGELEFLSGKQEMMRLGVFDDVDMAMMVHTSAGTGDAAFSIGGTTNAHVSHQVRYIGKSAHAGGAPDKGVNALQAAILANTAINSIRETFREADVVRVHGIISEGGVSVNAVPASVLYEGRVRAKSVEIVNILAERIIRCYRAGALAMGASVEVQAVAGYHALEQNPILQKTFASNAELILGRDSVSLVPDGQTHGGSTDMGDLSTIMPVVHPYANSASGVGHGDDYVIEDYDRAVVAPAKVMTATILELLGDNAKLARETLDKHKPAMTVNQYVNLQRERFTTETYDPS